MRVLRMRTYSIILTLGLIITVGCAKDNGAQTADELANALQRNGITYQVKKPISTSNLRYATIDEAVALEGDNLKIEVFRIEDQRTYEMFAGSAVMLKAVEREAGQPLPGLPPSTYSRKPFVVIIRQEPEQGQVRQALTRIFGE